MVTETRELTVFHCVIRHGSYAKAAEELGLTPSGVSRLVSRLEARLGARLVHRTTRKLSLTEAGTTFHTRTAQVLVDLADAEAEVQEVQLKPRGRLRMTTSVVFGQMYVAPLLPELFARYPDLTLDLSLTDRFVDLIDEGMDLALRIGTLSDSRLIARRLCTNRRMLVASESYLKRRGMPKSLDDIANNHDCILFNGLARPREWNLRGPEGPVSISVSGRLASNNIDAIIRAAKKGVGIALGATMAVDHALLAGDLVRVLPEYEFEPTALFAVYPSARQLSSKVRAAVDFFSESLHDPPPWDVRLDGRVPGFHIAPQASSRPTLVRASRR